SLKKMIPADSLWPLNDVWKFHCARQEFHTLIHFESALNIRYGKSNDANEFVKKSEVACYEAIRPMFEAVIIHKPQATGVVQWMLNASWPRLFWQLYDYYLTPGSAFFGTMKACSPLSIMYNYGDGDIYVSNELGSSQQGLSAVIKVYNLNSKLLFNKTISFDIEDFTAKKIMDMPQLVSDGNVYFIDLAITDRQGDEKANNFYWLSPRKDVIDETKTDWIYTPNKEYADFTSLGQLPETSIEMKTHF